MPQHSHSANIFAVFAVSALVAGTAVATPAAHVGAPSYSAAPQAVFTDTRVGTNLGDLRPGSGTGVVFVDAMKQAAPWSSTAPLSVDKDGNVTQLARGQWAQTVIYLAERYPSGDYTLLYDGSGAFEVAAASGTIVQRRPGRLVLRLAEHLDYGIRLRLTMTDPRNYARNIRLILPGFEAVYAGAPFHPLFLKALASFNVLRFKDWMHADTDVASEPWPARTALTAFTQAGPAGVAPEYLIALANATGADPWFTFPMGVTNMYVTQFAALVHARLDPRLHPSFEYGQAAWKPGTATNAYAALAGRNFQLAPGNQAAALAWYAARSVQIFRLVQHAYGPDAARVVRVLNGPLASTPADAALDRAILAYAGSGSSADAFAVAADDDLNPVPPGILRRASPADILDALEAKLRSTGELSAALTRTSALLQAARLPMIAYEGGITLESSQNPALEPALANLFAATSRTAGIRQVTRDVLQTWHTGGGGLFMAKSLVGLAPAAGTSALLERLDEPLTRAYKFSGVSDYMHRHPSAHALPNPAAAMAALAVAPDAAPADAAAAAGRQSAAVPVNPAGISIDAGGGAAAPYVADTGFGSGTTTTTIYTGPIDTSGVTNPAPQAVYQTGRRGSAFRYVVSGLTPAGAYTVRLHFAENYWAAAGKRIFNVGLTGTTSSLTGYDIFARAGAAHKALAVAFDAVAADSGGTIAISFTATTDQAQINGIEVLPGTLPVPTPTPTSGPGPSDYLTYHSDNNRTGWNAKETLLNTSNVGSAKFGVQTTIGVDGDVLAQPLFVANYPVPGLGIHNLLIVATENDSVYAFDAGTGALIWKHAMGPAQASKEIGDTIIFPSYGIGGTPVIVRSGASRATIYLVAASDEPAGSRNFHTRLHALDAGTGIDQLPPLEISATATLNNGSQVTFNPAHEMNRPGLLWSNNSIYVAFGSHGDGSPGISHGWMLRYAAGPTVFRQIGSFITTQDATAYYQSSIWMSGFAPAADNAGNIYFATGNGAYDANTSGGKNYGESVVKLSSDLSHVLSFFTPQDWLSLNTNDLDLGSAGVMLLPSQPGLKTPNLAVMMGKTSKMFLLNRDNLGGEQAADAGALQAYKDSGAGVWGGPAFYDNGLGGRSVYYQTGNDYLRAFALNSSGTPKLTQSSASTQTVAHDGSTPVVSSNGSQPGTAIVWLVAREDYTNPSSLNIRLEAYDANNVARMLYHGVAGQWGEAGGNTRHNGYVTPLVANGKVYVGGTKTVTIFHVAP